jgi:hypothetical protein
MMMIGSERRNESLVNTVEKWDCVNLNSTLATYAMPWDQIIGHVVQGLDKGKLGPKWIPCKP